MFLPYKIDIDVVKGLPQNDYEKEYSRLSEAILKERSREELRKVLIDGSNLQEAWFPTEDLWRCCMKIPHLLAPFSTIFWGHGAR